MIARATLALAASLLTLAAAHAQSCPAWSIPSASPGPNGQVSNLLRYNNKLVVFGNFDSVGGIAALRVAEFDGSAWTPLSAGMSPGYSPAVGRNAAAVWRGKIYAAGSVGPSSLGRGGIWDGSSWTPWGTNSPPASLHLPGSVFALGDGSLLIDGTFEFYNQAGNLITRRHLVKWFGSTFIPLSNTQYGPRIPPDATQAGVYDALNYQGKVLLRTVAALSTGPDWNSNNIPLTNGLCTFDRTSGGFAPFPAPALNGNITRMLLYNGELYVCGNFTATADNSITLNNIARWTGTQWAKCGNGLSRPIDYMTVGDDGSGEKIHLLSSGTVLVTAYNNPDSTTIDTLNYRGVVRFDGDRFTSYGAATASGYTTSSALIAATYDPGTGPALYFGGIGFNPGTLGNTNFARRGPAPAPDTDNDGLLDTWELNGIDIDCNGTVDLDLPAMGANWQKKDVFVEVDSMIGRAPAIETLNRVVTAFANGNNDNVNGTQGINLHIIFDPADQSIPLSDFDDAWPDFHTVKAERFGNAADRTGPNRQAIIDAKRLAFHYCIFGNTYDGTSSSGYSELPGNDFMVTLGEWPTPGGTPDQQAGTFMHELGHTLGLLHGGHQPEAYNNFKPNYHSIMSYAWQLASNRAGWTLDYSREALPDLNEHNLVESAGIGGEPGTLAIVSPSPNYTVPESGPVDWNRDLDFNDTVAADINNIKGDTPALTVLQGFHDWPNLFYNFRTTPGYANGESPESSHTDEQLDPALQAIIDAASGTPTCPADLGIAGGLPGADGLLDNNDFIAFITYFFASDPHADLGIAGGLSGADTLFDNNDFIAFINHFFNGC